MFTYNRLFIVVLSSAVFFNPAGSFGTSLIKSHTQDTLQLKPIPNSFQTAASTFLPEWVDRLGVFSSPTEIDFSDIAEQHKIFSNCVLKGFNRTSCEPGLIAADFCAENSDYFRNCLSPAQICRNAGFTAVCEIGYVKGSICPEDEDYGTCIPNPCTGFDYTLSEATAPGYLVGDKCLSGTVEKFTRSDNPCPGFAFDISNCGTAHSVKSLGE